ncbi:MAG: c-type cytochrome [Lutibacter sp.]
MFGYGFTRSGLNTTPSEKTEPVRLSVTGEMVYQKNCAACHGIDRQGNPPTFPSLIDINKRMNKGQIINQLITGKNAMPSFAHLTEPERYAISGYLLGEQTEVDFATEITPVENGRSLFIANCARCHKATPDDIQPPDQRDWGMQPAILGGISEKYESDEFENIVNMGSCYMPSFESLTKSDKGDIYTYLQTMKEMYVKYRTSRGMGCSMCCRNRN